MIIFTELANGTYELDKESLNTICSPNALIARLVKSDNMNFTLADDNRGANCKFWLKNDVASEGMLFKYSKLRDSDEDIKCSYYGELILDIIAYFVGFEHTSYYPCRILKRDGSFIEGTISPSYKEDGYTVEYSAQSINRRYIESQYDNNNGFVEHIETNTVYEYIKQLRYLYPYRVTEEKAEVIKNYLLKVALLDFLSIQLDRHWGNFGFLANPSEGIISIKNIPYFDNEYTFNLNKTLSGIEGLAYSAATTNNPMKTYYSKIASKKSNSPVLGIKTSICNNDKGNRLVLRKFEDGEKSNYDIFLSELAHEIQINPELRDFYNRIKAFKLEEKMREVGYFPECVIITSVMLLKARMQMLDNALEQKRSEEDDENTPRS